MSILTRVLHVLLQMTERAATVEHNGNVISEIYAEDGVSVSPPRAGGCKLLVNE